ncbi:uncharacterized protein LOC131366286 isoform X2 [Hemibagrus wyckioides]|uniref:uncharacterized protein LOC131366286 isoform X2 n=1 Tax=Hemibagrus wyckioides TaxID=337641 RepID=UPI00266D6826|nr:uncharacterized protein LOC131366286 isoform X2 [Hemibagrus wyckioides]
MTMPVRCKTPHATPPLGQYISEPVNTIVRSPNGCNQGQVITSELNLMEMTEVEYKHLQDLIQSHMEAQDVPVEVQINPPSSTPDGESEKSSKVCPSPYTSPESQPDASSSSSSASVSSNQGLEDSEVPSAVMENIRCVRKGARKRNRRVHAHGSRLHTRARVCLEKRFMSLLCNSMDMTGIAVHSQLEESPKAEMTAAEGCAHTGNQGDFSQDDSKHPEDILSKNLGISKTAESVPRSPWIIFTDTPNEEPVSSMEKEEMLTAVKLARRHGARPLQAQDPNIIQGSEKRKPGCKLGQTTRHPLKVTQRKEKHNFNERERRRKIRLCCDELNMLVPYCNRYTDTATTLQWTTAYLKYIREVYGNSIKQEFQNTFCGKTGVRIKPSCADDATECKKSASDE